MRRLFFFGAVLAVTSCKGLFLENGNAYPCDFSEGPGKRDEVCQPGDICGANNLCQKFIYEGPRFEGTATLPSYGPDGGVSVLLHPLVLDAPLIAVSGDLPLTDFSSFYAVLPDAGLMQERRGHVEPNGAAFPTTLPPLFGALATLQSFHDGLGPDKVLLRSTTGRLAVAEPGGGLPSLVQPTGTMPVDGARVIEGPLNTSLPVAWGNGTVGRVVRQTGWDYQPWVSSAGRVFDVAALTVPPRLWVFALEADRVEVIDIRDGGVTLAASMDPLTATRGALKTDKGTRVISAVRSALTPLRVDVLSTFQVTVTADGPQLSSPWPDCRPCERGEHVELMAPSVSSGLPAVDVVCMGDLLPPRAALRVVGSVALTQLDGCLSEELSTPLPFARVASTPGSIVHWDSQWSLLVGGRRGELWWGESITELKPEFLDRVPLDVAPAIAGERAAITVIADDYLAVQQIPESLVGAELPNGFRRVPLGELGVPENSRLLGFVHGVSGWAIDSTGLLVRANLARDLPVGVPRVEDGPRLVTASEDLVRDSIGGEAFTAIDGGPIGFFLTADDSLYFVQNPEGYLDPANEGTVLLPDLTPEPSVPIRSLALERTPLGTDGIERGRGYLVTSRNVYSWELSGSPARWSSTPLALTFGEPVEVWFDSPRSALGRVGYRDGQIFSLPGGYPLAEALPEGPNGEAPLVLDYENLGGWPVAYASTGLFIAQWDQVDGKLQNRFPNGVNRPMTWREVTLPNGETPWKRKPAAGALRLQLTKPGRLFVDAQPKTADGQLYNLLLFNDDEVRQVAHHLRK